MHELGIVFHLIDLVEEVSAENELTSVTRVTLELGEVSGVVGSYLDDCWKWAVARTDLMQNCELVVEETPAITVCNSCGRTYRTVEHGKVCPHCGSPDTVLLRGNEIQLKEIEGG